MPTIKELFDVQYLSDYDSQRDRIIIEPKFDKEVVGRSGYIPFLNSNNEIGDYIAANITDPVSGNVYIIADKSVMRKFYIIYVKMDGINFGKLIRYVNDDAGDEPINYNLSEGDYNALKLTPVFAGEDDRELAMFMAVQEYSADENRLGYLNFTRLEEGVVIGNMLEFLKKGLWFIRSPFLITSKLPFKEVVAGKTSIVDLFGQKCVLNLPNNESDYSTIIGPYDELCRYYLSGKNRDMMVFGGKELRNTAFSANLAEYNRVMATQEKIQEEKSQEEIVNTIPKSDNPAQQEEITKQDENAWDAFAQEAIAIEPAVGKKKKKSGKKFVIEGEISVKEKGMALNQTANEFPQKIKVKTRTGEISRLPAEIGKATKNVAGATEISRPSDWDYVYSIKETSLMYNKTVGKTWDKEKKELFDNPNQTGGMTIEEWNAYFIANPQYAHLIEPAIGRWGGMIYDEKKLMEMGVLLINPRTKKLEYKHQYLVGNAYDLLNDTIAAREYITAMYGQDFYDRQLLEIKKVTPEQKLIDGPDPDKRPFIHPLDDINIKINIKSAGNIQFPRSQNKKILAAYRKMKKAEQGSLKQSTYVSTPMGAPAQRSEAEDLSAPQDLNIIIFFKHWLADSANHGIYRKYEIPTPRQITWNSLRYGTETAPVDAVEDFYFGKKGFIDFAQYASSGIDSWNLANPSTGTTYENIEQVSKSDFFEFKDNLKAMVNQAFQDFMRSELSEESIAKVNDAFNHRYNGFIKIDASKYPIFVRHRKYFKDVKRRIEFLLEQSQVDGMKFATINNSSIMAHEVGRGKTSMSIAYISHIFETNQAGNIMVVIPKALLSNNKWKEEIAGNIDLKRNEVILGISPPDYNLVELGNLTPSTILGSVKTDIKNGSRSSKSILGSSKHKTYRFKDIARIEDFKQMREDVIKSDIPKTAYDIADSISLKGGWSDVVMEAKIMDSVLYKKCRGSAGDFFEHILDIFNKPSAKFWKNGLYGKNEQLTAIALELVRESMIEALDPTKQVEADLIKLLEEQNDIIKNLEQIKGDKTKDMERQAYMTRLSELELVFDESASYRRVMGKNLDMYVRDSGGRKVKIADPQTGLMKPVMREIHKACEDYILNIANDTFAWVRALLNKMHENGIYEYGTWHFKQTSTSKNIFLVTHDALNRIGFTHKQADIITDRVTEFSSFQNELQEELRDDTDIFDGDDTQTISTDSSAAAELQSASEKVGKRGGRTFRGSFKRIQKKALEKQYEQILEKVQTLMTSDSPMGKLQVDELGIDGFVFDEAHKGKKLFTNAVSNAEYTMRDEIGNIYKIKKSSHDIHGGGSSTIAILMFGMCQYIRSPGV